MSVCGYLCLHGSFLLVSEPCMPASVCAVVSFMHLTDSENIYIYCAYLCVHYIVCCAIICVMARRMW